MGGGINIHMKHMTAEDLKKPGQKRHTKVLPNKSHVMISYQWDVQQSMLSLRDALKNDGYNVWMDIDKLGKLYTMPL